MMGKKILLQINYKDEEGVQSFFRQMRVILGLSFDAVFIICGCDSLVYLNTGNIWWQYQPFVVSVDHAHHSNGASGQSPRVLVHILLLQCFLVLNTDFKHLGEILT